MQNSLRRVAQHGATIADQQEIDRNRHNDQLARVACRDHRRAILEVELASARHVHVAGRLVRARIQIERHHQNTDVLRRVDQMATIRVRNVAIEELRRNIVVNRNTVRADRNTIHRRHRRLQNVFRTIRRNERQIRHRVVSVPVLAVVLANHTVRRIRIHTREVITRVRRRSSARVRRRTQTNIQGLDRPLEVIQEDFIIRTRHIHILLTMHTDQRETNTLDEDIVNFRIHEDIVDDQLQLNCRLRERVGRVGRVKRSLCAHQLRRRRHSANQFILRGEVERHEALAVRNRHRRNRQTGVQVEPEQQRNPQFHRLLRCLRGLRARSKVFRLTHTGGRSAEGFHALFLTDIAAPTSALARLHTELPVEVIHITAIRVQRVTINLHLNLLDQTVTQEVRELNVVLLVIFDTSQRRHGRGIHNHVESHIVEEVAKLRDRELGRAAQFRVTALRANLVIFVADGCERLKVRVHEEDMRLFDIHQRRRRINVAVRLLSATNIAKTAIQQMRRHQHTVLLTIIGNQSENTTCRHFLKCQVIV